MKKALIIAFHYPPEASSSGVLRTLKFTRYLVEFGWTTTVISPDVAAYQETDNRLLEQVPQTTKVIRTKYINTKRTFSILGRYPSILAVPDSWIGWAPYAIKAANKEILNSRPDLIYSTSPHATSHVIAMHLSKKWKIPWVADFRDPWYEEIAEPDTTFIVHWLSKYIEKACIKNAKKVILTTKQLRRIYTDRYSDEKPEKFITIVNGYDAMDFPEILKNNTSNNNVLTIVHPGSINQEFRDPAPLFKAFKRAEELGMVDLQCIRIKLIGPGSFYDRSVLEREIQENNLSECVEVIKRMSYEETLNELCVASVGLLLQSSDDTKALVPAKLYEYLYARIPILALVKDGASSEIINEAGCGWVVDPDDSNSLVDVVVSIYKAWKSERLQDMMPQQEIVDKYDRHNLSKKLANEFDEILIR